MKPSSGTSRTCIVRSRGGQQSLRRGPRYACWAGGWRTRAAGTACTARCARARESGAKTHAVPGRRMRREQSAIPADRGPSFRIQRRRECRYFRAHLHLRVRSEEGPGLRPSGVIPADLSRAGACRRKFRQGRSSGRVSGRRCGLPRSGGSAVSRAPGARTKRVTGTKRMRRPEEIVAKPVPR
jgi:hypothetical protein